MLTHVATNPPLSVGAKCLQNNRHNFHSPRYLRSQQTRSYRFGFWSSDIDLELHRDLRKRQRRFQKKCAEVLSKRSLEHRHAIGIRHQTAIGRMMSSSWYPIGSSSATSDDHHYGAKTDFRSTPRDDSTEKGETKNSSVAPDILTEYEAWKSQWNNIINPLSTQVADAANRANSVLKTAKAVAVATAKAGTAEAVSKEPEPEIDPITNRRVVRENTDSVDCQLDGPSATFKSYRSQFKTSSPVAKGTAEISSAHSGEYSLNHLPLEDEPGETYENVIKSSSTVKGEQTETLTKALGEYDGLHSYRGSYYKESEMQPFRMHTGTHLPSEKKLGEIHDNLIQSSPVLTEGPEDGLMQDLRPYEAQYPYVGFYYKESEMQPFNMNRQAELKQGEDISKDELDKYGPYMYKEEAVFDQDEPKYDDLEKYRPKTFDSFVEQKSCPEAKYDDLEKYRTLSYDDFKSTTSLEADTVSESLKEFESRALKDDPSKDPRQGTIERLRHLDLSTLKQGRGSTWTKSPPNDSSASEQSRRDMEKIMTQQSVESDAVDREAHANIQMMRSKTKDSIHTKDTHTSTTGNYVRDFPEDFAQSWTANNATATLTPKLNSGSDGRRTNAVDVESAHSEKGFSELGSPEKLETSLNRTSKLESALSRDTRRNAETTTRRASLLTHENTDLYSKRPQGLETSFAEECARQSSEPVFVKTYVGDKSKSEPPQLPEEPAYDRDPEIDGTIKSPSSSTMPRPEVYKILAYDSTANKMSMAETTSVAEDQSTPLTPAEALMRVSNPAKFFPYFAPLQSEGFEILSGNGDVLVFRKVRAGWPSAKGGQPVNPIDLMGKPTALPNAAAFASPTGFVNYDTPQVEVNANGKASTTGPAPFDSKIDVRREEPVFSGAKSGAMRAESTKSAPKKKKSVVKRVLIGGAWVAGISYALGVIGEYFATGGADGLGPGRL